MYCDKTFLAIIPARRGSKGLTEKNIKLLCGKPLIAWSIKSGLACQYIDEVMVSTDCPKTRDIAMKYGANVPFLRPDYLATDTATSVDVVKHVVDFYKNELGKFFDYIVLLEPTSPLREQDDLDNMIVKLVDEGKEFDSIVSIGEVQQHPAIMKKIDGDNLIPFCEDLPLTTRRQDNEVAYFPYGVAYIVATKVFLFENTFYSKRNTFHKIKRYQCYEIDDIYDFLAIENIMCYMRGIK